MALVPKGQNTPQLPSGPLVPKGSESDDPNIASDVTRSAVGGASKGLLEAGKSVLDVGQSMMPFYAKPMTKGLQTEGSEALSDVQEKVDNLWNPGQTLPGKLTEAMTQWLSVAGPMGKSLAIKNGLKKWAVAGGVGDFAAFDPYEERLSNVLASVDNPVFSNAFTKWMASDEDDPVLEARMKQAVEGTLLGTTFDGFLRVARTVKGVSGAKDFLTKAVDRFSKKPLGGMKDIEKLAKESEEIIISGEARLGESFPEKEFNTTKLDALIDETGKTDAEGLTFTAERLYNGERPTVIVRTDGGEPVEILEGGDVVQLMGQLGKDRVRVKTIETPSHKTIEQDAQLAESVFRESEEQQENLLKKATDAMKGIVAKRRWVDVSADSRDALLKKGGREAEKAVMQLDMISGATPRGKLQFREKVIPIYDGLGKKDVRNLDRLISAHRGVQIDLYKGGLRRRAGLTGKQLDNYISKLREEIGDQKFQDLQRRARKHFEAMRDQLTQLLDNGIIDADTYKKLYRLDYTPTQYLDQIDPEVSMDLGGHRISVPDSGIQKFRGGKDSPIETDQRMLLSQVVIRTQNRIARNKANLALKDFAVANKDNGIVSLKKFKNATPIRYVENGETKEVWMDSEMAQGWISSNPEMSRYMANMLRWASATALVKPLATGHNPGFVLASMPMDASLAYLSTSQKVGYSAFPLKYVKQLSEDLSETFRDAALREGAFNDAIEDGLGMNFLAHQGRDFLASGNKDFQLLADLPDAWAASKNIDSSWEKLKDATSYMNETAEIWMRLAIRNRGIKNGLSPEEASYEARRYFDLSRGGSASKAVDNIFPYFNAFMRGFASVGRTAKEEPARMAQKVGWLGAMATSWHYWNYATNPEGYEAIADKKKATHFNITTPLKFRDKHGNDRHLYFSFKKDPTSVPLTMLADAASINMYSETGVDESFLDALGSSFIEASGAVPSLQAYNQYVKNKDYWNNDIWKNYVGKPGEISPEQEYIGDGTMLGDTPEIYKQLGQMTGMSPVRLQESLNSVMPDNTFTAILGGAYQTIMKGVPEDIGDQHVVEMLSRAPMLRRVVKLTHPAEKDIERENELAKPFKDETLERNRQLNIQLKKLDRGDIDRDTVKNWIKSQPKADVPRLSRRFATHLSVNKVYERFNTEGIPSKYWWFGLANEPVAEARGEVFYWKWRDADPENRRKMEKLFISIDGVADPMAWRQFQMNKEQFGSSQD